MRNLFITSFLAAVAYAALTAYDVAEAGFAAAVSATHARSALADSLK